ncbi:MAG: S8 family serine peptidase [Candidatus Thorarchaeota archaeon]
MQRKLVSALLVTCLVLSSVSIFIHLVSVDNSEPATLDVLSLDFHVLSEVFGEIIPVVVKFENGLTNDVLNFIDSMGLEFSLGSPTESHIGSYYLLDGTTSALEGLMDLNIVSEIAAQTHAQFLESTRDVSIPEINADDVWAILDDLSRNVTGEGILIADLDSGVDWRHPDLWFADGGDWDWLDNGANGVFDNGTDGVDFNTDGVIMADEALYALDLSRNRIFDTPFEWLWVDNVTQNGIPDIGEPFFVVNDTSGDGYLNTSESLVMLGTPKTKYIFENDGTPSPHMQAWERGVNLTSTTHTDDSPYGGGHGTSVAGVLLGGQLGYRHYVGVAPDAELMMIRVIGDQFTWLTLEEGLAIANNTGADVILTEIGSWTYHYLDGSSPVEGIIDDLVAQGIPVISPSGNLGGKDKHAMVTTAPDTPHAIDFTIPPVDGVYVTEDIAEVYITVLSADPTDFVASTFSLSISGITINLNPGVGENNWFKEINVITNLDVESYTSISSRGTRMLAIVIYGVLPTTSGYPWHQLNIMTPDSATIHAYISDSQSSWTGGCIWMSDVSNAYQICWPSTADRTISVASYRTRNLVGSGIIGDIASFSSIGPRIDGILKQGVAAPGGYDIISDYADGSSWSTWYNAYGTLPFEQGFGSYKLFSGTSASGPHVAGCAALLLQLNSSIGDQIHSIIKSTARLDSFTGPSASNEWGHGKLDINAAARTLIDDVTAPIISSHTRTPFTPTQLDSVTIDVPVSDETAVDTVILSYHNGTTWSNVTMSWTGSDYQGVIPALPTGTLVSYDILANDTSGNWAVAGAYSYTVQTATTTTTTTTTTSSGTTSTTDTTTTTTTSSPIPTDGELDTLRLALLLTGVMILVVFYIIYNRRRSR